ncbi:hypothetical protein YC2023_115170 [Brassica napus]
MDSSQLGGRVSHTTVHLYGTVPSYIFKKIKNSLQHMYFSQLYRYDQSTVWNYQYYQLTNDSATFVVFDREMTKLSKQDATALAMGGTGGQELPRCLEELAGKDYIFQIYMYQSVQFHPKPPCLQLVTVASLAPISRVAAATKLQSLMGEGGQATVSARDTVAAANLEIGDDEANPACFEGREKNCSRPRE